MKKSRPIGIVVLAIFFTIASFGYIKASILGYKLGWEITTFQRILGILSFSSWTLSAYFLVRPSEFGWKFILFVLGVTIVKNTVPLFFFLPFIFTGKVGGILLLQLILIIGVMEYIYKKKSYFTDYSSINKTNT